MTPRSFVNYALWLALGLQTLLLAAALDDPSAKVASPHFKIGFDTATTNALSATVLVVLALAVALAAYIKAYQPIIVTIVATLAFAGLFTGVMDGKQLRHWPDLVIWATLALVIVVARDPLMRNRIFRKTPDTPAELLAHRERA